MRYDFDEIIDRSGTDSYKWKVEQGELPMWVADMDFRTAPAITEAVIKRAQHGIFGYSEIPQRWQEAYIRWWKERHGVEYKKEELLFSTGVIPIISSCIRRLTSAGEKIVIMTPVYNVFFSCIKHNGRVVEDFRLDYDGGEYSIDFDRLGEVLSDPQVTMMILSNPHNPIGRIWDRQTLERIGELAFDSGVVVISDEIHCDITDPGREYTPFAGVSEKCRNNCVVCISPTKAFNIAGIQTAAAVVPEARLRHKVRTALSVDNVTAPNAFAVQAAVEAFERGGEWLDRVREYIFGNKQVVKGFIESKGEGIRLIPSEATYLLWLDCSSLGLSSKELGEFIRKQTGLFLSSGDIYGEDGGFLRMNIACPRSRVKDGLERLERALNALKDR